MPTTNRSGSPHRLGKRRVGYCSTNLALSHRMPAITVMGQTQVQILQATATSELPDIEPVGTPGRQAHASKKNITIECGSGWLQVSKLKINRGKGLPMDAAAARTVIQTCFSRMLSFSTGS